MRRLATLMLFFTLSLQAGTRPPAAVQSGPYSWTTGDYQYDATGNIIAIGQWTFAYDPLNRLAASHVTTPDTVSDQTYTYDPYGNMIEQTTSGIPTPFPTGMSTNHLDPTLANYDDRGRTTQLHPPRSAHVYGFTYDALDAATSESVDGVTTSYFVYTVDGERLRIENGGTKHWRIRNLQQKVLRDVDLSGASWSIGRDYVYRGDLLFAAIAPSAVEHFTLDHLGSIRLITDAVGNRLAQHTYLPFGQEAGAVPPDGEPMKFTGHERDDDPANDIGQLDYMHARYYSSALARFLSIDPALDAKRTAATPQLWNRYTYVHDSPMMLVDPNGKWELPFVFDGATIWDMALAGVGAHLVQPSEGLIVQTMNTANGPVEVPPGVDLNANIREAEQHRPPMIDTPTQDGLINQLGWFYGQVKNKGPWDYKWKEPTHKRYEAFGNFNYGVPGTAAGIPPDILYRAAGAFQRCKGPCPGSFGKWYGGSPHGDDPIDQTWIKAGIDYYNSLHRP